MSNRKTVVRLRDRGSCYLGEIEMPLDGGGRVAVSALGFSPWKTLRKVATQAKRVATDPAFRPFVPARVSTALRAASGLARMAQSRPGMLRSLTSQLPPQMQRLATTVLQQAKYAAAPSVAPPVERRSTEPDYAAKMYEGAQYAEQPYDPAAKMYEGAQYAEQPYDPDEYGDTDSPPPHVPETPEDEAAYQAWGPGAFPPPPEEGTAEDEYGDDVDNDEYFQDEEAAHEHYGRAEPPLEEEVEEDEYYEDDDAGRSCDGDDDPSELGWLPLVALAAKYGPTLAKKAHALYKARQRLKAEAKVAAAAKARSDAALAAQQRSDQAAEEAS